MLFFFCALLVTACAVGWNLLPLVENSRLVRRLLRRVFINHWLPAVSALDVRIDGSRAQRQDIFVLDDSLFARVVRNPSLGMGEGYMDGLWRAVDLHAFFTAVYRSSLFESDARPSRWRTLLAHSTNLQSRVLSRRVAEVHYDAGNDLFREMLDSHMQYSCGWFGPGVNTLEEAQHAKLRMIGEKLCLKPGMRVLDIGCGWGGLLAFLTRHYGISGVGLTLSREQAALASRTFPDCSAIEFMVADYRQFCGDPDNLGVFDRVVSVGMFEHVGPKNYRTFFECALQVLDREAGVFLLHTIGGNRSAVTGNDWLDRYIFPGGVIPSVAQIGAAAEGLFVVEDWHNFGPYYARTLAWWERKAKAFFATPAGSKAYPVRFQRMWEFYLVTCRVLFEQRHCQLWQLVLTPRGHRDANGVGAVMPRLGDRLITPE